MKNSAAYKLAIAKSRGSHFAIVELATVPAEYAHTVAIAPDAFDWLRDSYGPDAIIWPTDCDYARGAIWGTRYALANTTIPLSVQHIGILITQIRSHNCHGNEESAAIAAAHATWELIEDPGINHPIINHDLTVTWPGSLPHDQDTQQAIAPDVASRRR